MLSMTSFEMVILVKEKCSWQKNQINFDKENKNKGRKEMRKEKNRKKRGKTESIKRGLGVGGTRL